MALIRWLVHTVCASSFGYSSSKDMNNNFSSQVIKEAGNGKAECGTTTFQMPLHYPRYKKADYEKMEEWKVDMLLREYGLRYDGTLEEKRCFAMGAFLWPDQY